jgi:hypothetical protein
MTKFDQLFAQIAQEQNLFTPAFDTRCKHYALNGLTARASDCGLIRIIDCRVGKTVKWSAAHRVGSKVMFGGITEQEFATLSV